MMSGNSGRIDFGYPVVILRLAGQSATLRIDLRALRLCLVLLILCGGITLLTLSSGDYHVAISDVIRSVFGQATGNIHMVVVEWRLPRAVMALVLGAALGASGAIFQSLTHNPLGSPDVIGLGAGSYTGALAVIILTGGEGYTIACGAVSGGLITAMVICLLALRNGSIGGHRLILVGIGVSAMLTSVNTWLLLNAKLEVAMTAAFWAAGSLAAADAASVTTASLSVGALLMIMLVLHQPMRQLETGDDLAAASGVSINRTRLALIVTGVCLTAISSAFAGPIAFVSLVAPQLARRLGGFAGAGIPSAALMGALLLACADYIAQHAFSPTQIPAGLVTISLGGGYLIWLLLCEAGR